MKIKNDSVVIGTDNYFYEVHYNVNEGFFFAKKLPNDFEQFSPLWKEQQTFESESQLRTQIILARDEYVENKAVSRKVIVFSANASSEIIRNRVIVGESHAQGHFLERFIEDEHYLIRCELAYQGYALDRLMFDEYWMVRALVARQGYGLEYLIYDRDARVRAEVAAKGYGLDILINDPNVNVKLEMIKHGYCLDILINDPNHKVRFYTKEKIKELNNGKNTKKNNTNLS